MGWSSPDSFLTRLFSGDPLIILLAFLVTITLPALLHLYFYTASARTPFTPTFLLLGSSGSGKTSLVSLLSRQLAKADNAEPAPTYTSQDTSTVGLALSPSIPLGSNKYRSVNDYELKDTAKNPSRYQIIDTPGHGKLRAEQALANLTHPGIRGVIFMVDSSALDSGDSPAARDTVTFLHDLLLALQRRKTGKVKAKTDIPILIAANKQDLFTAIPPGAIRDRLQTELERVRVSKSKGISAVDREADADDEEDVLGGGGEEKFSFKIMEEEYGIVVDVIGGAVRGEEAGKGVIRWEEWIGSCL